MLGRFDAQIAFSPEGSHLVSGSSDKSVYIWQVERPELGPWALPGHQGEVSCVDWCPSDFTSLVTCGDDCTVRRLPAAPGSGLDCFGPGHPKDRAAHAEAKCPARTSPQRQFLGLVG